MAWAWNLVCGRFINFRNGKKFLTFLTFGGPSHKASSGTLRKTKMLCCVKINACLNYLRKTIKQIFFSSQRKYAEYTFCSQKSVKITTGNSFFRKTGTCKDSSSYYTKNRLVSKAEAHSCLCSLICCKTHSRL